MTVSMRYFINVVAVIGCGCVGILTAQGSGINLKTNEPRAIDRQTEDLIEKE